MAYAKTLTRTAPGGPSPVTLSRLPLIAGPVVAVVLLLAGCGPSTGTAAVAPNPRPASFSAAQLLQVAKATVQPDGVTCGQSGTLSNCPLTTAFRAWVLAGRDGKGPNLDVGWRIPCRCAASAPTTYSATPTATGGTVIVTEAFQDLTLTIVWENGRLLVGRIDAGRSMGQSLSSGLRTPCPGDVLSAC